LGSSPSAYLGLIHAPWLVFLQLPLDEGFAACMDGVGKAWICELVPSHRLGTAQGLYQGASGAAILLAGLWADLVRQSDGRIPLLVSGTVAHTLAAALPAIVRTTGQPDE
jgi:MFS family permease